MFRLVEFQVLLFSMYLTFNIGTSTVATCLICLVQHFKICFATNNFPYSLTIATQTIMSVVILAQAAIPCFA